MLSIVWQSIDIFTYTNYSNSWVFITNSITTYPLNYSFIQPTYYENKTNTSFSISKTFYSCHKSRKGKKNTNIDVKVNLFSIRSSLLAVLLTSFIIKNCAGSKTSYPDYLIDSLYLSNFSKSGWYIHCESHLLWSVEYSSSVYCTWKMLVSVSTINIRLDVIIFSRV